MIYHHVYQKDDYGCAIGAAAMLTHVSYDVAKQAINPKKSLNKLINEVEVCDTTTRQLLNGLRTLGAKVKSYQCPVVGSQKTMNFVLSLKHDALLTLDEGVTRFGLYEHCVAWCATRKRIYDSGDHGFNPNYGTVQNYFDVEQWRISHVIEILDCERNKTREYIKRVKR